MLTASLCARNIRAYRMYNEVGSNALEDGNTPSVVATDGRASLVSHLEYPAFATVSTHGVNRAPTYQYSCCCLLLLESTTANFATPPRPSSAQER